jgi:hypothetical protein
MNLEVKLRTIKLCDGILDGSLIYKLITIKIKFKIYVKLIMN